MSTNSQDDTVTAVTVRHTPATFSAALAVAAAFLAVLSSGLASIFGLALGLFGLAGVAGGLFALRSERLTTVGVGVIFLGIVVSDVFGEPVPAFLVFSAFATIVAFDLSQNAFSVGRQLTEETETIRGELVHAAATVVVGAVAITVAYGIYLASAGGQPVGALVFVLLGGIVLLWSVRA